MAKEKALELAKRDNDRPWLLENLRQNLGKMKRGEPTWEESNTLVN